MSKNCSIIVHEIVTIFLLLVILDQIKENYRINCSFDVEKSEDFKWHLK